MRLKAASLLALSLFTFSLLADGQPPLKKRLPYYKKIGIQSNALVLFDAHFNIGLEYTLSRRTSLLLDFTTDRETINKNFSGAMGSSQILDTAKGFYLDIEVRQYLWTGRNKPNEGFYISAYGRLNRLSTRDNDLNGLVASTDNPGTFELVNFDLNYNQFLAGLRLGLLSEFGPGITFGMSVSYGLELSESGSYTNGFESTGLSPVNQISKPEFDLRYSISFGYRFPL